MVATVNSSDPLYFTIWMDFLTGIGFWFYQFILLSNSASLTPSLIFLAYIIPTVTGTFTSLPRYSPPLLPLIYPFRPAPGSSSPLAPGNYPHFRLAFNCSASPLRPGILGRMKKWFLNYGVARHCAARQSF